MFRCFWHTGMVNLLMNRGSCILVMRQRFHHHLAQFVNVEFQCDCSQGFSLLCSKFGISFDSTRKLPQMCPPSAVLVNVAADERMIPLQYKRDVRHSTFSTTDVDLPVHLGDAVALYPENPSVVVSEAVQWFGSDADKSLTLEPRDDTLSARVHDLGHWLPRSSLVLSCHVCAQQSFRPNSDGGELHEGCHMQT